MPARVHWTDADEKIVVETLLKEKDMGNQADSGWKSSVWMSCEAALVASPGEKKTAGKIQDHWTNVR